MGKIIDFIQPFYRIAYFLINNIAVGLYMFKLKLSLRKIGHSTRIFFANIPEPFNIEIGHHVYINKNCDLITTGSKIQIGNFVMIGPNTSIIAQNHDISDWEVPMLLSGEYIKGNVTIKDDVWIGANVTILQGVKIGRGSVIGAGSVVTKNIPEFSIYAGVPAKKIRDRFNPKTKKQAKSLDLNKFKNQKIDWFKWGTGGKSK